MLMLFIFLTTVRYQLKCPISICLKDSSVHIKIGDKMQSKKQEHLGMFYGGNDCSLEAKCVDRKDLCSPEPSSIAVVVTCTVVAPMSTLSTMIVSIARKFICGRGGISVRRWGFVW
jgi:hypothetical protein